MAAFHFFMDDSGTSPNQSVAVAAGWIAKAPSWHLFDREWRKIQNDPSHKFSCMHMSEFAFGGQGTEFENWNLPKKEAVLNKLSLLVRRRALKGFALGVVKKDFDDIVPPELRNAGHENHYTYAVRSVMGMIHKWREANGLLGTQIEYFFDFMEPRDRRRREIEGVFASVGTPQENLVKYGLKRGGFNFKERCPLPALQAADMFAWTIYRAIQNEIGQAKANLLAKKAFKEFCLPQHGLVVGGYNTREHLIDWVKSKGLSPLVSS